MLNISTSIAVSWPTPVSSATAPVQPVVAVPPVQTGGNDGKTQMGFGRDDRAAPQHAGAARVGADGRVIAKDGGAASASGQPGAPMASQDPVSRQQARQEADQAVEQQRAKDKQAVEHLQSVLSRMWAASAAVIDRALGIEPPNGTELPGNQSDTAPDLSAVAATLVARKMPLVPERVARPATEPLPWPVMQEATGTALTDGADGAEWVDVADVVAYDEHGNSSLAPLEAGSLISHRV